MPTVTQVPEVCAALRAMFDTATPDAVPVHYGPPPGGNVENQYIAVAYGGDDRPSVTGARFDDPGANRGEYYAEDIDVWCTISTASGDQDGAAQMLVTENLFNLCVAALRANHGLDGLLKPPGYADVGSMEWIVDEGGALCTLFFTVHVEARWL